MNKTKLLSIFVITLLTINISLILVLFLNKQPHQKKSPADYLVEKLNFDKKQQSDYTLLMYEHQDKIKDCEKRIRILKTDLYEVLATDSLSTADTIIYQIGELRKEIEYIHFNHFLEVKSLCKASQIEDFNKFTKEIARVFVPNDKKRKK